MLTFLELYQTLLGFVFFKLYTDAGLVYPPPLDVKKQDAGAGVGAFQLQDANPISSTATAKPKTVDIDGKKVSTKDVRQTIKSIAASAPSDLVDPDVDMPIVESIPQDGEDEEFVPQPSTSNPSEAAALPTLHSLSSLPQSQASKLFAPYTFWLSRETSRPIFEFIVRSFGGRIGWPASSGGGSPFDEIDESITHVIIDRPVVDKQNETEADKERRRRRKYVQPQWIVDCVNAGKILLEEPYLQGKTLPPHLSPFGGLPGAYDPTAIAEGQDVAMDDASDEESQIEGEDVEEDGEEEEEEEEPKLREKKEKAALKAAMESAVEDPAALRAAELEAEAAGVDFGTFEKEVAKSQKKSKKGKTVEPVESEKDMNKMMMSNKQRKLYERMKYGERKRTAEVRGTTYLLCLMVDLANNNDQIEREARGTEEIAHKSQETARKGHMRLRIPICQWCTSVIGSSCGLLTMFCYLITVVFIDLPLTSNSAYFTSVAFRSIFA